MEENKMVCNDCGMKFNSQEELDQHNMSMGHGGGVQQPGQDMPEQTPPQMPGDEGGQQDEGMGEDDNPRGAM